MKESEQLVHMRGAELELQQNSCIGHTMPRLQRNLFVRWQDLGPNQKLLAAKRDEIEQELLKTGVMTEEDVEAIRQLKETHNVKSKRRGSISVEELDTLKGGQNSLFGMSKRNSARVSPVNY